MRLLLGGASAASGEHVARAAPKALPTAGAAASTENMRRPADPPGCCRAGSGGHCCTPRPPPQRPCLRGASQASLGASQQVDHRDFDASRVTLGVVTCHCAAAWIGGAAPWGWGDGVSTGWGESSASQVSGFLVLFRHHPHLCLHLHMTHLLPMCLYPNVPSL